MRGKSIKLYIMGEQYKNLKTAELSNWTGKAYIGQRKHVQMLQSIEELSSPGIYILISEVENSYQKKIYVGEADEVNGRIAEQFKKILKGNPAYIKTLRSKNNSLGYNESIIKIQRRELQ
ncbi:hypothetical protein FHR92_005131 [Fontibacillus solani]|uniref:GIY-YIG domain-containing protein n=1 Tax=Fontibacillus solani TaxID=1572857 RepID=A0A7W3SZ52_9BACL|nr:hypothetical protein [Fontibacillus solani]MBA9088613.1 hypothetical protein [Fontibacillus solani]